MPSDLSKTGQVTCSDISVPANRSNNDGKTITLHAARLRGPDPIAREPLMLLSGGPGQPAEIFFDIAQALRFLGAGRDIIFFDQRGMGTSLPRLECKAEESDAEKKFSDRDPSRDDIVAVYDACLKRHREAGVRLADFNTVENALDVDDVRRALGVETMSLLGISYGARLALEVMRRTPAAIKSVLLDSVPAPERNPLKDVAADIDEAVAGIISSCNKQGERARELCAKSTKPDVCLMAFAGCDTLFPDLDNGINAIAAELEAHPFDARSTSGVTIRIDRDRFVDQLVRVIDHDPDFLPYWVNGLRMLMNGSDRAALGAAMLAIDTTYDNVEKEQGSDGVDSAAFIAYSCNTEPSFGASADNRVVRTALRGLSSESEEVFQVLCKRSGWATANPALTKPVKADIPTLVLSGTFDFRTPVSSAQLVSSQLSKVTLAILPGVGHTVLSNRCGQEIAQAFLTDAGHAPDVSCIQSLPIATGRPGRTEFLTEYFGQ